MNQEFETQVLDIDKDEIVEKLRKLGAKEEPEVLQKRWVFDIVPCNVASTGSWIRLRQAGNKKPTITYKSKSGKEIHETEELEIEVSNFNTAAQILSKLNFSGIVYQENMRHKFELNGVEFSIDTWPKIPSMLEVEAASEKKVQEGLKILGLENKDVGHLGHFAIYDRYGIDLSQFKELKF